MAERARPSREGGHILVEIQDFAQQDVGPLSGVGQYWRLAGERRGWQGTQLRERLGFDIVNFTDDPGYLGIYI
jgi:hypothetical protein